MFRLVSALFGCAHKHCTFPRTAKPRQGQSSQPGAASTYIVCLDCGKEFPYDWQQMKVIVPTKHVDSAVA